jgi:hypothetical protein
MRARVRWLKAGERAASALARRARRSLCEDGKSRVKELGRSSEAFTLLLARAPHLKGHTEAREHLGLHAVTGRLLKSRKVAEALRRVRGCREHGHDASDKGCAEGKM